MAETKPLISVIVPVYKAEKYLDKCVRSILAQTYENLEVILVDDGSPDCSGELCDGFAAEDPRVRVIHQENGGVSTARNAGLEIAEGKYICFVDSDDYTELEMIEKLYAAIEYNNAELAICGAIRYGRNCVEKWSPEQQVVMTKERVAAYLLEHYLEWIASSPWAKLYMREKIGNLRFDKSMSLGEDLNFNIQYATGVQTLAVNSDCLYCYTDCEGSLAKTYRKGNYEAICHVYETTVAYLKQVFPNAGVNMTKVNYKLFSFCCSFMAQNIPVSDRESEWAFIKAICENPLIQQAVRELPTLSLPYRIYAWAINQKSISVLYVLSQIRYWINVWKKK